MTAPANAPGVPGVRDGDAAVDWESWLAAWEGYLTDMVAWASQPEVEVPAAPTLPQPGPVAPAHLGPRLRRASALREHVVAQISAHLEVTRRWQPAGEYGDTPGATRERVLLDL